MEPPAVLVSVSAACQGLQAIAPSAVRVVEAFADCSALWTLDRACSASPGGGRSGSALRLVQRVVALGLARRRCSDEEWRAQAVKGLHDAAAHGDLRVVQWLVENAALVGHAGDRAALVDSRSSVGWRALHRAARKNHLHIVEYLVKQGAEINQPADSETSALQWAAAYGNVDVVAFLVGEGASIAHQNKLGRTALHHAVKSGEVACLAAILGVIEVTGEADEVLALRDKYGKTALHLASGCGQLPMVKLLVSSGAQVVLSESDTSIKAMIVAAAEKNHWEVVCFLLMAYDGPREGLSAEMEAALRSVVVCTIISSRLDVLKQIAGRFRSPPVFFGPDVHGRTPLHEAAKRGRVDLLAFLLDHCAFGSTVSGVTDLMDSFGTTAMIEAAIQGNVDNVRVLLRHAADANAINQSGQSALHFAARNGHTEVIDELLASGVDANVCDEKHWTPLHYAASEGHLGAAVALVEHDHASVDVETNTHQTPLLLAVQGGHFDVMTFLMNHGASDDISRGSTLPKSVYFEAFGLLPDEHPDGEAPDGELAETPSSITEDLDIGNTSTGEDADALPEWLIDPSDVEFDFDASLRQLGSGLWLGAAIEVKQAGQLSKAEFVQELAKWSTLNHPHIVKLYGAYHIDNPFFVFERPEFGSLREYLNLPGKRSTDVWEKLYEAALGLQYLHERGIVHGAIRCRNIVVASNGLAKLANFGAVGGSTTTASGMTQWKAPEVLDSRSPPSFASDVFALGMTIVEAIKDGPPWDTNGNGINHRNRGSRATTRSMILQGSFPEKPRDMTVDQWGIVKRMCCYNPRERLKTADVVRELDAFACELRQHKPGEQASPSIGDATPGHYLLASWQNLGDARVPGHTSELIPATYSHMLERVLATCNTSDEIQSCMNRGVYNRLASVFGALQAQIDDPPAAILVASFGVLLRECLKAVNPREMLSSEAFRLAASRRTVDDVFAIHRNIDRFMSGVESLDQLSAVNDCHQWRPKWKQLERQHQSAFMERIEELDGPQRSDTSSQGTKQEVNMLVGFELSKRVANVSSTAEQMPVSTTKSMFDSSSNAALEGWFIPEYEVEFDEYDEFSRGAFGSVHHGRWMNAKVVVKKINLAVGDDDGDTFRAAFLNEVRIWHRLYHPHVVQLFGACHVHRPFFVSEFAANGQLDNYLQLHPLKVWKALHEVALALRYLRAKRVVHGDLKCNNILVGTDGRAKLTDFGLSLLVGHQVQEPDAEDQADREKSHPVGAVRWKAPEVLRGERSSFASDVFSFGMCIVEAVSGEFPWGMQLPDAAVKFHVVKRKKLPLRPPVFTSSRDGDTAWQLVLEMCRYDPRERLDISDVATTLHALASPCDHLDRDYSR
jgi:serine/threonine protein kinase/ankyrin repeat protein